MQLEMSQVIYMNETAPKRASIRISALSVGAVALFSLIAALPALLLAAAAAFLPAALPARAAEAVCIIGMVRVMMDQKPEHIDMLPRTLQLDPFRHRTLGFLAAAAGLAASPFAITARSARATASWARSRSASTSRFQSASSTPGTCRARPCASTIPAFTPTA